MSDKKLKCKDCKHFRYSDKRRYGRCVVKDCESDRLQMRFPNMIACKQKFEAK